MKIAETLSMVSSHQVPLDIHIPNGTFLNHYPPKKYKIRVSEIPFHYFAIPLQAEKRKILKALLLN